MTIGSRTKYTTRIRLTTEPPVTRAKERGLSVGREFAAVVLEHARDDPRWEITDDLGDLVRIFGHEAEEIDDDE